MVIFKLTKLQKWVYESCIIYIYFLPFVYPQLTRGQLIEHELNSTQLEATLDTFMGWDETTEPWFHWAEPEGIRA